MTTADPTDSLSTLAAMRRAGQMLAKGSTEARVFLEERSDLRLVLGSGGQRALTETSSRGAAIDGSDSIHVTDPSLVGLVDLAERSAVGRPGPLAPLWNAASASAYRGFDRQWLASWESVLAPPVELAVGSIPGGRWTATLVAFRQAIWVASRDEPVAPDVRQGLRVELKAWIDRYPKTLVTADRVLRADAQFGGDGLVDQVLERVLDKHRSVGSQARGPTCAVLAPGVGGVVIHELVGHALEGDVTLRQRNWLQGVHAKTQRALTVVDDPRRGRGAWLIDDEGVPSQSTTLVADGHPTGLLLDRATSKALGRSSNGHGRRSSYLTPPRPRMGCTWVVPGPDAPSDVLRDTSSGVFIRRMTSGHTDPRAGRASFLVTEADRIVGGRLERPLEPFVVELDGVETWRSIDRVCSDLEFDTCVGSCVRDGQPLAVSVGAPTIRIGVIRVVS